MTPEHALWSRERDFWIDAAPRIEDPSLNREGALAVLTYRATGKTRTVRCRSTYARTCGSWMLLEHRQYAG